MRCWQQENQICVGVHHQPRLTFNLNPLADLLAVLLGHQMIVVVAVVVIALVIVYIAVIVVVLVIAIVVPITM